MKPDYTEMFASGEGAILAGVFLTVLGIVSALGLLLYVLQAWSVYTIARRRGIRKPWLAWIPVAGVWTVGSIADQYQYVVNRRVQSSRKVLLGLTIGICAMVVLYMGVVFSMAARTIVFPHEMMRSSQWAAFFLFFFFFFFAVLALVVVCAVFFYISLYHVYNSCNPDTCVVFLILSIVFSVTVPFFLVADRNLDLGMPPRRTQAPEPLPESGQETDPYESL